MNHEFSIKIKAEFKKEDDEKDHPLLNEIKTKFNS